MNKEKPIPLAGSSPCSATMLDKAVLDRGVQPAALIARLNGVIDEVRKKGKFAAYKRGLLSGLSLAINEIECEAKDAERDAAG